MRAPTCTADRRTHNECYRSNRTRTSTRANEGFPECAAFVLVGAFADFWLSDRFEEHRLAGMGRAREFERLRIAAIATGTSGDDQSLAQPRLPGVVC